MGNERGSGHMFAGKSSWFAAVLLSVAACGGGTSPSGSPDGGSGASPGTDLPAAVEPGVVKGAVLDTSGKPLSGAEVKLCPFPSYAFASCSSQNTASDGRYSMPL